MNCDIMIIMLETPAKYLLLPGRHQAVTQWQVDHIHNLLGRSDVDPDVQVVWAITSANHGGTRRNPIPGVRRLCMAQAVADSERIPSLVYPVTNMRQRPNFAHFLVEDIHTQIGGIAMNTANTLVLCSTPGMIEQYRELGFAVDTMELDEATGQLVAQRPWDLVERLIELGGGWQSDTHLCGQFAGQCLAHYQKYHLGQQIIDVFSDPLITTGEGDITNTRDYRSYLAAFENGAQRKVDIFGQYVKRGKILDIGCATGETLRLLSQRPELFESDFYGVEVTRTLFDECKRREERGDFEPASIFFRQKNIMQERLFTPGSLDTAISMALTHEVESYTGREALKAFVQRTHDMLNSGGVYINFDVVGPRDKDETVYALLTDNDGENPEDLRFDLAGEELADFLGTLSSKARFRRFAQDFRAGEDDRISVQYETINGQEYAVLTHGDLCEFLAHKDYLKSWKSEMHERFCFFNYDDWKQLLESVGFELTEGSGPITNQWLIDNRFAPAAQVFSRGENGELSPTPTPETNVLLVAKKPE